MRAFLVFTSFVVGCAAHPAESPLRVRAHDAAAWSATSEFGDALRTGRPVILEVDQGEVIPLQFSLEGDDLATPKDAPPIPLVAKRHFFLRISRDGIATSTDGVSFDAPKRVPGSFRVGVSVTKEGARAEIEIRTPKR